MKKKNYFLTWSRVLCFVVLSMLYPMSAFADFSQVTFTLSVKAHSENTGKGFVYISTSEGAPATNQYGQDKTADNTNTGTDPRAFYVYAKPVRGYEFDSWTMSSGYATECYSNMEGDKMTFSVAHTQAIADKGSGFKKGQTYDGWYCNSVSWSGKPTFTRSDVTVTANWKTATKFVGTFIPSAHGQYSVKYTYAILNNARTGLTDKTDSYTIDKGDPLNSVGWRLVDTYNPDVITLTAGPADNGYGFDGWGSSDAAGNHSDKNATYVLPHTGAMTVSALYSPVSFGDVTSNPGVVAKGAPVSGTVVVATKLADAKADFRDPVFNNSAFRVTSWSYSSNALTINYTYTQPVGMTEDQTAQLTLTSLGGENRKNINVTARLARVTGISSYDEFLLAIKNVDVSKSGVAYFTVENATDNTPFNAPTFGAIKDDQGNTVSNVSFTVNSWSYADNQVRVNYTYTHNNIMGVHSSDLTLTAKTGSSYTVTILGDVEEVRADGAQASVLTPDGEGNLVEQVAGTWTAMLAAAQSTYAVEGVVPTIRIYEDFELAAVATITKSINVDLYGKTISGAVNNLFTINGSGITVTITDRRVNGKIDVTTDVNAGLNAVYVQSGNLIVDNAIISSTNTNATATAYRAAAVKVDAGATFTLERGKILATAPVYAYGVYSNGTTTVNGGLIHAEANADHVAGVYQNGGSITTNGGVIEAVSKQLTASAADSYGAWGIWTNTAVTATINGGTISGEATSEEFGKYAYAIFTKGTTTINGGTLTGTAGKQYAYGVRVDAGTTTVNGGTISCSAPQSVRGLLATNAAKMYVKGGDVTATATTATDACGVWLSGTSVTEVSAGVIRAVASTSKAYSLYCNANTVKLAVTGGKFNANATSDVAPINTTATAVNCVISDGFYDKRTNLATYADASQQMFVYAIPNNILEYEQGYRYSVGNANTGAVVCKVISDAGTTWYNTLEKALSYVNNNPGRDYTIIMTENYTMTPGNYTLPSYATLVVPYYEDQVAAVGNRVARVVTEGQAYVTPKLFRKLTMPSGVNIDVYGTIEASSTQSIQNGNTQGYVGNYYGHIVMAAGSHMTLQNGSSLVAWGYVTGEAGPTALNWKQGTIDARRGAIIRELFQLQDWTGGTVVGGMLGNSQGVFPVNQYAIQNVEVPVTYHPGARLICAAGVFIPTGSITAASDGVNVVGVTGDVALFLMNEEADAENTWVKKMYNPVRDSLNFAINSSAKLGSLDINISGYEMDSRDYILPITNNISIELMTGEMEITQSTMFLPGSELTVDKEATIIVNEILELGMTQKPVSIYACASTECGDPAKSGKFFLMNNYTSPIKYSPSWASNPRSASVACPDAKIEVRGTLDIRGHAYTSEAGANIFSTNADAGTVIFSSSTAAVDGTIAYVNSNKPREGLQLTNTIGFATRPAPSAKLKNGDGTYTSTTGAKDADAYGYKDDVWSCWKQMGCMAVDVTDPENPIFYAKPGDYVAVDAEQIDYGGGYYEYEGNDDHTFSASDGSGRLFILDYESCQWWEVEKIDELYYCATNDKYYFYDEDMMNWLVKKINVKWANWDGSVIEDYEVNYNATPEYLGSFPTRSKDAYYTYTFTGWLPEVGPVKNDVVYIAQFEKEDVMYSIVFKDENDKTVFQQYLRVGEIPACKNEPQKPGYYLYWEPTISAVTGDQVYQATYQAEPRTDFNVVFQNFDGSVLQETVMHVGDMPIYTAALPEKASISVDAAFEFDGWTPAITEVSADVVYTAKFKEVAPKYTITFKSEDGATTLQTSQVAYGETPVYTGLLPTKAHTNPTGYYYELVWSPLVSAVVGNQTYRASFVERVNTRRLIVDVNGMGTVSVRETNGTPIETSVNRHSEVYAYNKQLEISATANVGAHYHFARWSDGSTTPDWRRITVTGTNTYTAIFELDQYTITDGSDARMGTVDGAGTYDYGSVVTLTAKPKDYCRFVRWSDGNTNISRQVTVSGNVTYTAEFDAELFEISVPASVGGSVSGAGEYVYGTRVTLTATPNSGYRFDRWDDGETSATRNILVLADATYTPVFVRAIEHDIVDWSANEIVLNMFGYPTSINSWKINVNGIDYTKDTPGALDAQRRLHIPAAGLTADADFTIIAKNGEVEEGRHTYKVAHVYDNGWARGALANLTASSTLFVRNGKLTISANTTVGTVYVAPGAELEIAAGVTLNVAKLVLRTESHSTAVLTNNGTLNATEMYYTRIMHDATKFFQFALPLASTATLDEIMLSGNKDIQYGKWVVRKYDPANRAKKGCADAGNWVDMDGDETIDACKGYEIFSNSKYYREFYFPVTYAKSTTALVSYNTGDAGSADAGWNFICSPLTGVYKGKASLENPVFLTFINEDNKTYTQKAMVSNDGIQPATPFYYQTAANGYLTFGLTFTVPTPAAVAARQVAAEEPVSIQWLQIALEEASTELSDETNFFLHPSRFTAGYEHGFDLSKMIGYAERPQLYSSMPACGMLAFNAIPDELVENALPLGVYVAHSGMHIFALNPTDYMERFQNVYLFDSALGITTDLLTDDYSYEAEVGTTENRFFLQVIFRAPSIATDLEDMQGATGEESSAVKIYHNGHIYILRDARVYDVTGRETRLF